MKHALHGVCSGDGRDHVGRQIGRVLGISVPTIADFFGVGWLSSKLIRKASCCFPDMGLKITESHKSCNAHWTLVVDSCKWWVEYHILRANPQVQNSLCFPSKHMWFMWKPMPLALRTVKERTPSFMNLGCLDVEAARAGCHSTWPSTPYRVLPPNTFRLRAGWLLRERDS